MRASVAAFARTSLSTASLAFFISRTHMLCFLKAGSSSSDKIENEGRTWNKEINPERALGPEPHKQRCERDRSRTNSFFFGGDKAHLLEGAPENEH